MQRRLWGSLRITFDNNLYYLTVFADVMELADMQDLGSCAERRAGSSPAIRIFAASKYNSENT